MRFTSYFASHFTDKTEDNRKNPERESRPTSPTDVFFRRLVKIARDLSRNRRFVRARVKRFANIFTDGQLYDWYICARRRCGILFLHLYCKFRIIRRYVRGMPFLPARQFLACVRAWNLHFYNGDNLGNHAR